MRPWGHAERRHDPARNKGGTQKSLDHGQTHGAVRGEKGERSIF